MALYRLLVLLLTAVTASPRQNLLSLEVSCSWEERIVSNVSKVSSTVRDSIEVVLGKSCVEEVELQVSGWHLLCLFAQNNAVL